MAAGRSLLGIGLAVVALLLCPSLGRPLLAQNAAEVNPLGRDETGQVDRFQVTLRPGATLWTIAGDYLPLTSLDLGDQKAFDLVAQSYQRTFPDRQPNAVRPEDSFTLEVPAGTFVTDKLARDGSSLTYRSFNGDQLTAYPKHPTLIYRLIRAESPDRAEVSLTGQTSSAAMLARDIFQVDQPDYLEVRTVRGALNDRNLRVTVDLNRKFLDDFRNFRDRAIGTEPGESGLKVFTFSPDDRDNPFLRVEDAIGDGVDPAVFPRDLRLAYYRDATVRRYLVTESGDALGQLNRPDAGRWQRVLSDIKDWQPGVVEPLPAFSPAVNQSGQLIPGRLLVLSFSPKVAAAPTSAATVTTATPSSAGLSCLGVPLAVVLAGLTGLLRARLMGLGG